MKCRPLCKLGLMIPAGVLLVPLLLWIVVVLAAPTDWARSHVVAALERASGRSVRLQKLHVCMGGGVELASLEIGAPGAVVDPWLHAERIRIDVSLLQLLRGKFEPTSMEVDGAALRVLRRQDGSLELADLVRSDPDRKGASTAEPHHCGLSKLKAKLHRSRIIIQDEPTKTDLTLEGVEGEANWEGEGAMVVTLSGSLNQGPFEFTAHFDRSGGQANFEGQFRASEVVLDGNMTALRYVVPVLAGTPGQIQGRLDMDLYLRGCGESRDRLGQSLVGHGNLSLDPIQLDGTPLMAEISRAIEVPLRDRAGSIQTGFAIQDGRVRTDRLNLTIGRVPIIASGWTDFNGTMDYQIKLDGLVGRVPGKARQFLNGLDLDLNKLTTVTLQGNVDSVQVKLSGQGGASGKALDQILSTDDRDRLKVLGRRLRDKVLR